MSTIPGSHSRLDSIDAVRGLVMVIMALDHVRNFFSVDTISPTNLAVTTPVLFFTRWITHFCAPVFVFLAGTGAFLYGSRGRTKRELSRFLWTRGLWLVVLELTLVRWGWRFNFDYPDLGFLVIWALGVSMIVLAALVYLPTPWVLGIGLAMIIGHNAFDGVTFPREDWRYAPWAFLHSGRGISLTAGFSLRPSYPLVPWIGVMAAGYSFGRLLQLPPATRRRWLVTIGLAMIAAFLVLRLPNLYGDARHWTPQTTGTFTVMSILNCTKYPPSLLYLCMTLGPALLLLAVLDARATWIPRWLVVFGRVPLFYYLVHLYLIHLAAGVAATSFGHPGEASWILQHGSFSNRPKGYGYPLWAVYLAWVLIVASLYPLCRWYAGIKARSRNPWLSYV